MKRLYLYTILSVLFALNSNAQISISLATGGSPVVPAGWVLGGSASVSGTHVQLTPPSGGQAGRVYYGTPQTVGSCGAFTVEFEFQVIPSGASWAIADGLAFWIVNPLSGFIGGGGIGMPTNPNGLVLMLDNYNNDGVANDPLVSLLGYPAGFTGTYVEGSATNRLDVMPNQYFVWDGGWHHVKLTYAGGNIKVYFNHSSIPNMTGFFPLTTTGYFGFCGSTGGAWSTQSVRNVYIYSDNVSEISGPDVVCMGTTATFTDSAAGGTWSSSATGVGTIDATSGVFTPISPGVTTLNYSYTASTATCSATKTVTVNATSLSSSTGSSSICSSSLDTFTNSISGGTWSSSDTHIATIGSTTGILDPDRAGTVTVTYTLPSGCTTESTVTINTAPPELSILPSPATVCDDDTLSLTAINATTYNLIPPQSWEHGVPTTSGIPVDMWSYTGSSPSFWYQVDGATAATPSTGGSASGTYIADFNCRSLSSGTSGYLTSPSFSMVGVSSATLSLWVYRDVSAYNTTAYNSEALTVQITSSVGGTVTLGSIPRRGGAPITGSFSGTSTTGTSGWFQYTCAIPSGFTSANNQIYISALSRNGNNIYLDSVTITGTIGDPTWSPSTWLYTNPATTTAYTGSALNPVYMHPTGITTPTTITYTASLTNGTCSSTGTSTVTMNPNPAAITGPGLTCIGGTVTLSSATSGGVWTSSTPSVASVGSSSGIVTGTTAGTSTICYGFGGCTTCTVVTVVTSPAANSGIPIACQGSTTTLSNSVGGGTWSSSYPAVGSVDAATGVVTGITIGTTIITYGIATCYATTMVTVNPVPDTITGSASLCIGATTALSSATPGGLWTSSSPGTASVGVLSGIVTGMSAGTATISYRVAGCSVTKVVTVVTAATPIVGPTSICVGSTMTQTNSTSGGTWTSSTPSIATIGSSSGIVTGVATGTATITYVVSAGCTTTRVITITAAPPAITGTMSMCIGGSTTLSHSTIGGTWTSSATGITTVGFGSGVVTSVGGAGTSTITYTLPGGCITTAIVTVNAGPAAIAGSVPFCEGGSITLSSTTSGGTWSSSAPGVATVSSSGVVSGLTAGTATMCYAVSGCTTCTVITVNPQPAAISGASTVCVGSDIVLTDATPLGTWSSSDITVATVTSSGTVTGAGAGTATISYALPTGCFVTKTITVNASPATIAGGTGLCVGTTTSLTSTTPSGTWSTSDPSVASILSPGLIGGVSPGTATICYAVAGCATCVVVTVYAVPSAISGADNVCSGQNITLTNSASGGVWTSSAPSVASIDAGSGLVTGGIPGTTTITYSLGFGCVSTKVITVNPLPGSIGGTLALCQGTPTTLTCTPSGGIWFSSDVAVATVGVSTGNVTTGSTPGTTTISYTLPTGCYSTAILTVNTLPAPITGVTNMCVGASTTLSTTTPGCTWSSSSGNATVGFTTGVVTGVFTGTATITTAVPGTGCSRSTVVLVNGLPTGIGGSLEICEGETSSLSGAPSGGTWMSVTPSTATISAGSGILSGLSAGTTDIVYTLPTTCSRTVTATVNPLPNPITGTATVCMGQSTTLSSTTGGGTWSSSTTSVATISSGGVVTGVNGGSGSMTATITYTLPTGCYTTRTVTVYNLPGIITGNPNVCEGLTTTLGCTPSGGTWATSTSSVATIGSTTGIVTGVSSTAPGTATITYTVGTGCYNTTTVTVHPLPNTITGTPTTCVGSTTTLSNATPFGTWSSDAAGIASVGAATGIVTGNSAGTATISYTLATGCRTTQVVTIYALPAPITGVLQACVGLTTPLSTTTPGGTWVSSAPANASVDATTGVVTGVAAGTTATITYSLGTGCSTTAVVSVNTPPLPVTGPDEVCVGQTITMSNASPFGTWSNTPLAIATVNPTTGVVTGITAGTAYISYTIPTGCYQVKMVTVHALPTAITGPTEVCEQSSVTLSSTPTGGSWGTTTPSLVTVNPTTGSVFGDNAGVATIVYTQGIGCQTSRTITVNPQPAAITGNLGVCIGFTSLLANASPGGTWSSGTPSVGTIDGSGLVTSVSVGTTPVTYTTPMTGCTRVAEVTVNPLPGPVTGSDGFCNLSSTTYMSSPAGGTWSTSNVSVLTINPTTGVATGVTVDTADVIYTLPTGCTSSKSVFLILAPYPITGPDRLCEGQTDTLRNAVGGGVWSSSNTAIVPIDVMTAEVTGLVQGTANITYVLSTGCASVQYMTVNPIPVGITGSREVCEGLTTTLSNITSGGTWSSYNTGVATIGSLSGVVTGISGGATGDTTTVSYSLGTGCNAKTIVTVNPLPPAITGTLQVCEGLSTTLSNSYSGGVWNSSNPSVADINASTGVMTGLYTGTALISYTLPTSCLITQEVTVNPLPSGTSGLTDICVDGTTVLTNATPGGTWESSDTAIAIVDASGLVTGRSAGNVVISYVLPTGCIATWPMTINANPDPITGSLSVCAGFATNLYSGPAGGTWSAGPSGASFGYINPITGVVSGIMAGNIPITYSLSSGCLVTDTVTVITLPSVISGVPRVCVNDTTVMINSAPGGVWSISNANATINPATGEVVGVTAGTSVVTYTVGTGCFNVHTITVNPLPAVITGPSQVCENATIMLSSASLGGIWSTSSTPIATVDYISGLVTGGMAGTVNITYSFGGTGCKRVKPITVNQTPYPILGNPHICIGSSNTFTDTLPGGIWYSGNPSVANINPSTGLAVSVSLGTTTVSYRLPTTGCQATRQVTVQPLPVVYDVQAIGDTSYCAGGDGVAIGLSGSQPGVSYVLYHGSTATGYRSGTGMPINFGMHTAAGTYSVQATNVTSGCMKDMNGSITVVITPLAAPGVSIAASPYDSLCPGESLVVSPVAVNGGSAPTYLWKVNGVNVSTATSYSFVPAPDDIVTVIMTSDEECISAPTAIANKTIRVLPFETPIAGIVTTPDDTVCQFNPTTFTAAPSFGGSHPTYYWNVNGAAVGTGSSYTYNPVDGDIVNCKMISNYRCRLSDTVLSGNVVMSVDSVLIPTVVVYPEPGFTVEDGKPVTLHTTVTNGGANPQYQWKVNGYPVAGATADTYTAVFNDYDSVTCQIVSSGVCHNIGTSNWVFISVAPTAVGQTGINSNIVVTPNPTKGMLTLTGNWGNTSTDQVSIEVTNMLGQIVYRNIIKTQQGKLDAVITLDNMLANGMYILTLKGDAAQQSFHFVLER